MARIKLAKKAAPKRKAGTLKKKATSKKVKKVKEGVVGSSARTTLAKRIQDIGYAKRLLVDTLARVEQLGESGDKEEYTQFAKRVRKAFHSKDEKNAFKKSKTKRSLSGFMEFSKERRPQMKAAHPNMTLPEISKELGRIWQDMKKENSDTYVKFQNLAEKNKAKAAQTRALKSGKMKIGPGGSPEF